MRFLILSVAALGLIVLPGCSTVVGAGATVVGAGASVLGATAKVIGAGAGAVGDAVADKDKGDEETR